MTISLLLFGLFLGLRHALEADHVAAVTALARGSSSVRANARMAGLWGLGHAPWLGALVGAGTLVLGAWIVFGTFAV